MTPRSYFLDHLRTFMVFLVVLTHAGMTYERGFDAFWIVNDPAKWNGIALIRLYLDVFVMATLFFIAGYFVPLSLGRRSNRDFIRAKFHRIIIPWLVAVFTLIPAYKFIYLYSRNLPQEPWFTYFHFFRYSAGDASYFPHNPTQSWLWFLPVLFLFQLIYLAMYRANWIKRKITVPVGLAGTLVLGIIYSMFISLIGLTGWTHSAFLDFQRERLIVYFLVFMLGSIYYQQQAFSNNQRQKKLFVLANIAIGFSLALYTMFALNLFGNLVNPGEAYYFLSPGLDRLVYYTSMLLTMLCFLQIFLYSFHRTLDRPIRIMEVLNPNSYYVYLIHMIILGLIAVLLLPVGIPAVFKYLLLTVLTFFISHGLVYAVRKGLKNRIPPWMDWVVLGALLMISATALVNDKTSDWVAESVNLPDINLHEAAIRNDTNAIKQAISKGMPLDVVDPASGSSPLMTAIVFDQQEAAVALIDAGANVDFQDYGGSTPLHAAAYFCRPRLVQYLLDHGADPTLRSKDGLTPRDVVSGSFEEAKPGYDKFRESLGPLGLKLDDDYLERTRPVIARMLEQ